MKAIRAASEAESDVAHLSGMAAATLEGEWWLSHVMHQSAEVIIILLWTMIVSQVCSVHLVTSFLGMVLMPMTMNYHCKNLSRKMKVSVETIILFLNYKDIFTF